MLLRRILKILTWFSFKQFERNCENIKKVQAQRWEVIKKNIGKKGSLDDYKLTDYEDYRDLIEKSKYSDVCPLTGEPVIAWLKTSGTSNTPKDYPLTKKFHKELQRLGGPFLYSMLQQREHFLERDLLFISSPREKVFDNGIPFGPISYFNYVTRPFFIRFKSVVKDEDLSSEENFFNDVPVRAMASDLDTLMAIMPEVIVRFHKDIKQNFDKYFSRLEEFNCSSKRKAYLESIRYTDFNISELWPELKSIFCWKTSICALQLPDLEKLIDKKVKIIDAFYTTTEGSVTVPIDSNRLGGPFDPNGHVVEFLPIDKEPLAENLVKPWELKEGQNYEVVITTSMGLVRYRLFDVVECLGYFKKSPWLIFKQKLSGLISLGQTRISEEQLIKGLSKSYYELQPGDFFAPRSDGKGLLFYSNTVNEKQIDQLNKHLTKVYPQFISDMENDFLHKVETKPIPLEISIKRLPQQKTKITCPNPR